jgi:NAD(P)-dependent dehydrogenase (short-subunit alcohol dehydrogenase family)
MSYLEQRLGLRGKAAVIVGGGGGLGRAIAYELAAAGVDLALCDHDDERLQETVAQIKAGGGQAVAVVGDARTSEALMRTFAASSGRYGRLDILANVVGGTFRQAFVQSNDRGWQTLVRTNFLWLLESTQRAVEQMTPTAATAGASIINVTSIEAHRAAPNFAVYAAMKAAVTSLTRSLALEFAPLGIRVNTIAPDVVPTEGMAGISRARGAELPLADTPRGRLAARVGVPMARAGRYEDVGGCALFLASDLARFVTGTSLHPDGGALASSGWFNWPDAGYANFPPAGALRGYLEDEAAVAPYPHDQGGPDLATSEAMAQQEMARHIISEPEGA